MHADRSLSYTGNTKFSILEDTNEEDEESFNVELSETEETEETKSTCDAETLSANEIDDAIDKHNGSQPEGYVSERESSIRSASARLFQYIIILEEETETQK